MRCQDAQDSQRQDQEGWNHAGAARLPISRTKAMKPKHTTALATVLIQKPHRTGRRFVGVKSQPRCPD